GTREGTIENLRFQRMLMVSIPMSPMGTASWWWRCRSVKMRRFLPVSRYQRRVQPMVYIWAILVGTPRNEPVIDKGLVVVLTDFDICPFTVIHLNTICYRQEWIEGDQYGTELSY